MKLKKTTQCIIVIPVYKTELEENEFKSVEQCLKVLKQFPVVFVASLRLNKNFYNKKFPSIKFKQFNDNYFNDLEGYNRLLLSYHFYRSFNYFEYILIYQPDAWIFRNELEYWCNKGFDYIGAPLIDRVTNNEIIFFEGGNGGLSLRKISSCLKVLTSFSFLTKPAVLWNNRRKEINNASSLIRNSIGFLLDITIRNNTFFLFNNFYLNEDGFWSVLAPHNFNWYKTAPVEIAMRFCFEQQSSLLFEKTNQQLPFGCHAWEKYEKLFWQNYIN